MFISDIETITDGGRSPALLGGREAADSQGDAARSRQHLGCRPAQWRGAKSVVSLA